MMRSTARVTTSSHLKCREQERNTIFPQLHIMQNSSIQIPTRLGNGCISEGALVHSTSLSALGHLYHIPSTHAHCPAFCWYIWIRGISGISGDQVPSSGQCAVQGRACSSSTHE